MGTIALFFIAQTFTMDMSNGGSVIFFLIALHSGYDEKQTKTISVRKTCTMDNLEGDYDETFETNCSFPQ